MATPINGLPPEPDKQACYYNNTMASHVRHGVTGNSTVQQLVRADNRENIKENIKTSNICITDHFKSNKFAGKHPCNIHLKNLSKMHKILVAQ